MFNHHIVCIFIVNIYLHSKKSKGYNFKFRNNLRNANLSNF